ncbi:glycosyltransferase [Aestuariirhabdus sp. Z084]|uniref:glycosyltransferase n=1 Tax=Aestuariirhabdus haliotis TaxID=2918751 RepID=UPI00201B36C3|nr:glycosyltransferase [Aestuariirhabdus haliotis]MCL6414686.1 glycosyltransferase [Aestuariirhabdus haliotis]MCL6418618.1 glycosyltransferase [Aestuariirhabdus haliotis]
MSATDPYQVIVFSTLFPSEDKPLQGCFIYQRIHRINNGKGVVVVSPQPWFPFQDIIGKFIGHNRSLRPVEDKFEALRVCRPRFFSIPIIGKWLDPLFIWLSVKSHIQKLLLHNNHSIIDAHFAFPDGVAAYLLTRNLGLPLVVTLRGTEIKHCKHPVKRYMISKALTSANVVIGVSQSLLEAMRNLGIEPNCSERVGNGVDSRIFYPDKSVPFRKNNGFSDNDRLLITVGGLVPRKGQHLVIQMLPVLLKDYPTLHYILVGGGSGEGDYASKLKAMAEEFGVVDRVHFMGVYSPEELRPCLSAADLFVLATSNEGWANVILESMACGTPVVATDVGGNAEVISNSSLGTIVDYSYEGIEQGIKDGLDRKWNRIEIENYAKDNSWNKRIGRLENIYSELSKNAVRGATGA